MIISIIIPSYNQQQYLPDAIESALAQPVSEVIVVDDGSTDHSLEIAKGYNTDYPRVKIVSQVNKGLASARNSGIMVAKGEYVLPLDADDILLDNCVEKIIEVISQDPDADVVALSFREFGASNANVLLKPDITIEDLKKANHLGYCSAIRRSCLLEVGGYNPKMVWGAEDYDLWFDLLKRGKKFVTIQEMLWLYRVKSQSMWTETAKHKDEFMNQIRINHPEIKW